MKRLFTADWHANELPAPHTHSFLRGDNTNNIIKKLIAKINEINPEEVVFVGDVSVDIQGFEILKKINPKIRLVLIIGDKESSSRNYSFQDLKASGALDIFAEVCESKIININGIDFAVAHKPVDVLDFEGPSLCGHVHGIWRTQKKPNGQPIINVGMDAWSLEPVSEEWIMHQYGAVTKGYYDKNALVCEW